MMLHIDERGSDVRNQKAGTHSFLARSIPESGQLAMDAIQLESQRHG